jgi:hypothetical protein
MKMIPLTQGKFALVDDEDFEYLNQFKWCADKIGIKWYCGRNIVIGTNKKFIRMHRIILGLEIGDGKHTDHIDGNGLNNQRSNLRICTNAENRYNQKKKQGSSIYKCVSWNKKTMKWISKITFKGKQIYLGSFNIEEDAAKAYDKKAMELFGEFARTNFKCE